MATRDEKGHRGEDPGACKQHTTRAQKPSKINRKRTDKHHRCVERCIDPGSFVDPKIERSANVRQVHAHQSPRTGRDHSSQEHAYNTDVGMSREFAIPFSSFGRLRAKPPPADRFSPLPACTVTSADKPGRKRSRYCCPGKRT